MGAVILNYKLIDLSRHIANPIKNPVPFSQLRLIVKHFQRCALYILHDAKWSVKVFESPVNDVHLRAYVADPSIDGVIEEPLSLKDIDNHYFPAYASYKVPLAAKDDLLIV